MSALSRILKKDEEEERRKTREAIRQAALSEMGLVLPDKAEAVATPARAPSLMSQYAADIEKYSAQRPSYDEERYGGYDQLTDELAAQKRYDKEGKWRGGGLGIPVAWAINKMVGGKKLDEFREAGEGTARRARMGKANTAYEKARESDRKTILEQAVEDASNYRKTNEQRGYDEYLANIQRGRDSFDMGEQRKYDEGITTSDRTYDEGVTAEQRTYNEQLAESVLAEKQAQETRQAEITRSRETVATHDPIVNTMQGRLDELKAAIPSLQRMAGVKPAGEAAGDVWGGFGRWSGGTGPIAQYLPSFDEDTQIVEALAANEALATISSMEQPLTPVSDVDLRMVMNTGISAAKNESLNLKTAEREIGILIKEIKKRKEIMAQAKNLIPASSAVKGVRSIRQVN